MKIWRLTLLNLKKRKSISISLLLLIFLAALFLCIGLNVMTGAESIYMTNHTALAEPDNCYICPQDMFRKEYYEFLENHGLTKEAECIRVIGIPQGEIPYEGGTIEIALVLQSCEETGRFFRPVFTDQTEVLPEKAIYVPETLRQYGFASGDAFEICYKGNRYEFQIAGFFQTTCFGIVNTGGLRFYLPKENYENLKQELGEAYAMFASTDSYEDSYELSMELKDYIRKNADSITKTEMVIDVNALECEGAYSFMGIILAAILLGFSIVIALICLLVIRFRIHNTIETSIVQIGTLQALGFKAWEVISVYVLEYVLLATVGASAGILADYLALPFFGRALEGIYGLSWQPFGHLGKDVCCLLLSILIAAALSFFTARRIYGYAPAVALSGGIKSHSFRKNHFPLHKGKHTQVRMALKEMSTSVRQNIMVLFCITGVTFLTMMGIYLYVAFGVDLTSFKEVLGMEWVDVEMVLNEQTDEREILKEITGMEEVRKAGLARTYLPIYANNAPVYTDIYDDFDRLETDHVFEGRFPEYENELVITGVLADRWHCGIGDTVTVEYNGSAADYLIVGLSQTLSNSGNMMKMTEEGIQRLCPTFRLREVQIYLKEGYDREEFIQKLNRIYGLSAKQASDVSPDEMQGMTEQERIKRIADEKLARMMKMYGVDSMDYTIYIDGIMISGNSRKYAADAIRDFEQTANASLVMFSTIFGGVAVVILVTTLAVIAIMFAMLIKMILVQRRQHFGILKALGYTTGQLRLQIAVSLMPAVGLGTLWGMVLNHALIGRISSLAMQNFGISQMKFYVSPFVCIGMAVLIIGYAFLTAMLYAGKVKRITPYELLTE